METELELKNQDVIVFNNGAIRFYDESMTNHYHSPSFIFVLDQNGDNCKGMSFCDIDVEKTIRYMQ